MIDSIVNGPFKQSYWYQVFCNNDFGDKMISIRYSAE